MKSYLIIMIFSLFLFGCIEGFKEGEAVELILSTNSVELEFDGVDKSKLDVIFFDENGKKVNDEYLIYYKNLDSNKEKQLETEYFVEEEGIYELVAKNDNLQSNRIIIEVKPIKVKELVFDVEYIKTKEKIYDFLLNPKLVNKNGVEIPVENMQLFKKEKDDLEFIACEKNLTIDDFIYIEFKAIYEEFEMKKTVKNEYLNFNPESSSDIFNKDDIINDDNGSGNIIYPEDKVFLPKSFDLVNFRISQDDYNYYFSITLPINFKNDWKNAGGWDVQMFDVYMNLGVGKHTQTASGRNVKIPQKWDVGLIIGPAKSSRMIKEIEDKNTNVGENALDKENLVKDLYIPDKIKIVGRTLIASVEKNDFMDLKELQGVQIFVLGSEGYTTKVDTYNRVVDEYSEQWRFGGGSDYDGDPNVIDILGINDKLGNYIATEENSNYCEVDLIEVNQNLKNQIYFLAGRNTVRENFWENLKVKSIENNKSIEINNYKVFINDKEFNKNEQVPLGDLKIYVKYGSYTSKDIFVNVYEVEEIKIDLTKKYFSINQDILLKDLINLRDQNENIISSKNYEIYIDDEKLNNDQYKSEIEKEISLHIMFNEVKSNNIKINIENYERILLNIDFDNIEKTSIKFSDYEFRYYNDKFKYENINLSEAEIYVDGEKYINDELIIAKDKYYRLFVKYKGLESNMIILSAFESELKNIFLSFDSSKVVKDKEKNVKFILEFRDKDYKKIELTRDEYDIFVDGKIYENEFFIPDEIGTFEVIVIAKGLISNIEKINVIEKEIDALEIYVDNQMRMFEEEIEIKINPVLFSNNYEVENLKEEKLKYFVNEEEIVLTNNLFKPKKSGKYTIKAYYNNLESNTILLDIYENKELIDFERKNIGKEIEVSIERLEIYKDKIWIVDKNGDLNIFNFIDNKIEFYKKIDLEKVDNSLYDIKIRDDYLVLLYRGLLKIIFMNHNSEIQKIVEFNDIFNKRIKIFDNEIFIFDSNFDGEYQKFFIQNLEVYRIEVKRFEYRQFVIDEEYSIEENYVKRYLKNRVTNNYVDEIILDEYRYDDTLFYNNGTELKVLNKDYKFVKFDNKLNINNIKIVSRFSCYNDIFIMYYSDSFIVYRNENEFLKEELKIKTNSDIEKIVKINDEIIIETSKEFYLYEDKSIDNKVILFEKENNFKEYQIFAKEDKFEFLEYDKNKYKGIKKFGNLYLAYYKNILYTLNKKDKNLNILSEIDFEDEILDIDVSTNVKVFTRNKIIEYSYLFLDKLKKEKEHLVLNEIIKYEKFNNKLVIGYKNEIIMCSSNDLTEKIKIFESNNKIEDFYIFRNYILIKDDVKGYKIYKFNENYEIQEIEMNYKIDYINKILLTTKNKLFIQNKYKRTYILNAIFKGE